MQRGHAVHPDEDSAAISLRMYLTGLPSQSSVPYQELFYKVQNAIWYFMRRKSLRVIKAVADERYPLPRRFK